MGNILPEQVRTAELMQKIVDTLAEPINTHQAVQLREFNRTKVPTEESISSQTSKCEEPWNDCTTRKERALRYLILDQGSPGRKRLDTWTICNQNEEDKLVSKEAALFHGAWDARAAGISSLRQRLSRASCISSLTRPDSESL